MKNDFIVLSCDTFTPLPPSELFSFHSAQDSSATAVFFDIARDVDPTLKIKGNSSSHISNIENENNLYVGYQKETQKLLLVKSTIDIHESLDIRSSLLWRYLEMNITTTLQDAHIYIFKHWIIDLISDNEQISSIKSDLIPLLAKMQWQSILLRKLVVPNRTFQQRNMFLITSSYISKSRNIDRST